MYLQGIQRGGKKEIPTENGEESSLVDYVIELSNFDFLIDLHRIVDYLNINLTHG